MILLCNSNSESELDDNEGVLYSPHCSLARRVCSGAVTRGFRKQYLTGAMGRFLSGNIRVPLSSAMEESSDENLTFLSPDVG